jgi:hypothetical protein
MDMKYYEKAEIALSRIIMFYFGSLKHYKYITDLGASSSA